MCGSRRSGSGLANVAGFPVDLCIVQGGCLPRDGYSMWGMEVGKAGEGQLVMPFYLLCDVSRSMTGNIAALNDGIAGLWRAVVSEPVVHDVAWFSIMTYSDTATMLAPLGRMSETTVPKFAVEGGTNYGVAFRALAQAIDRDITRLRERGYYVHRPCALFLSGSGPQDNDWHQTFMSALTFDARTGKGTKTYPIFIPFGFWGAPESVLRKLAYPPVKGQWYHAKHTSLETALDEILHQIMTITVLSRYGGMDQPDITPGSSFPSSLVTVSRENLGQLKFLSEGGLGAVYNAQVVLPGDTTPLAYKEFTSDNAAQAQSAQAVTAFRIGLPPAERAELDACGVWPRALVTDPSGTTCGLLMPLLPPEFFHRVSDPESGRMILRPREMSWLIATPKAIEAAQVDMPPISYTDRLTMLTQLAHSIDFLHRHGWVYGDLSFKNAVFALNPPRMMLLDCDQAAALDNPARRQPSTPFWEPPECSIQAGEQQMLQDTATDTYKLGLAILRCLTPGPGASSARSMDRLAGSADAGLTDLIARVLSEDRSARPTAGNLHAYLSRMISLKPGPPSPPPHSPGPPGRPSPSHVPPGYPTSMPDTPAPSTTIRGHVFISYVHQDSAQVDQLEEALREAGIRVWRDTADLWPGEDWQAKIRQAITSDALVFLACFSRNSLARKVSYQNEELTLAIEQLRLRQPGEPWLIPVRFDTCDIPELDIGGGRTLTSIQRADLFGEKSDDRMTRLITAILRIPGRNPDH